MNMVFKILMKALWEALTLAFQDNHKPFHLCVEKRKGIAKSVLTQTLGQWKRPVVFLTKKWLKNGEPV